MILTRLTRAIREQNWFAVTLEFLIVIAGVVIGFQITAWREDAADRRAGHEYLVRIHAQLQANQDMMRYNIASADWVQEHTIRAIDALRGDPAELGVDFVVDVYVAGHGSGALIERDVYDELMTTGAFRTVSNPDTRQALVAFYAFANFAQPILGAQSGYQSALRRAMPHDVLMQMRETCAAVLVPNPEQGFPGFAIPDTCPPQMPDEQVADAVASLVAADLLPDLRESLADIQVKRSYFQRVIDNADTAIAALEREE